MADHARAAAPVVSTVGLAHSLGLRMVAEGVHTDVAYAELKPLGCDQAQGYFMSRAVPGRRTRLLAAQKARCRSVDEPARAAWLRGRRLGNLQMIRTG